MAVGRINFCQPLDRYRSDSGDNWAWLGYIRRAGVSSFRRVVRYRRLF